ncbi:unnamed protein product [Mytilus coruscus]|uniref:RING-type domain-containing protein n=1 Tax=Mytilus coruscus TaxID=42192 RepID=A0A6J8CX65_MYTCO|nr:unnamed protein product [Mytilus coruscus]
MASQYKGYYRYPYFRPNREEFYDICISESDNVISNFEKWNRYRPINHFIGNPDYKQWTPQGRLGTFFNTVDRNKMPTDMIYKIHKQGFYYENNLNIIKCHKCDSTYCSDTIGNITPCHWPHCDYVCASKDRCRTNSNDNYETKMTRKPLYNARNQTNISDALIPTIKLSMQYCKKTIQGWIIDEEAGRDIAKDMKEAKATSKKISDIKNSMCIRCGSEPPGIVFQNCYHCVTCCRCSECIDYCPKCDAYIMCRVANA